MQKSDLAIPLANRIWKAWFLVAALAAGCGSNGKADKARDGGGRAGEEDGGTDAGGGADASGAESDGGGAVPDGGDAVPDGGDAVPDGGDAGPDGGDTGPDTGDAIVSSGLALSPDARALAKRACEKDLACGAEEGAALTSDAQSCGRRVAALWDCREGLATLQLGDGLGACLSAIQAQSCEEWLNTSFLPVSACADVERRLGAALGRKDMGESCNPLFADCLPGLACSSGDPFACGMCVEAGAAKDDCVVDGFGGIYGCTVGTFCDANGQCKALRRPGQSCDAATDCLLGACSAGMCVSPAAKGEDCSEIPCGAPLFCGGDKHCVPRRAEGKSCTAGEQCRSGLSCTAGKCELASQCGLGGRGDPCITNTQCADGLACSPLAGCQKPHEEGQACDDLQPCASGSFCLTLDGANDSCNAFECTPQ